MPRSTPLLLGALLLLLAAPAQAMTVRSGDEVVIPAGTTVKDDLYVAAGRVRIQGTVEGDVVVAGGEVQVAGIIHGDVVVAGGDVDVAGEVRDDVLALGGSVDVDGHVGGSVRAMGGDVHLRGRTEGDAALAGGSVTQQEGSRIGHALAVAGATLAVRGQVAQTLRAAGQELTLTGSCQDAQVRVDTLTVAPSARIRGGLQYRAASRARVPDGTVLGGVDFEQARGDRPHFPIFGFWAWALLASLVAGLSLAALLPRAAGATATTLRGHPGWALAIGFGGVIGMPFFIIFALITVVGLPLGFFLGGVYMLALYLAWLVGALALGDVILSRWVQIPAPRGRWVAAAGLGVLVLGLLQGVPIVGWLLGMVGVFAGFGAMGMSLARSQGYGIEPPPPAPDTTPGALVV